MANAPSQQAHTEIAYRGCLFLVGTSSLVGFSALLGLAIWQILAEGASALLLATAGVFGVLALAGLIAVIVAWRRRPSPPEAAHGFRNQHQHAALTLAKRHQGRLTVADVSLETTMSVQEAEAVLDDFARRGVAELTLLDNGTSQYIFASFTDDPGAAPHTLDPLASQIDALDVVDEPVVLDLDDPSPAPAKQHAPASVDDHSR